MTMMRTTIIEIIVIMLIMMMLMIDYIVFDLYMNCRQVSAYVILMATIMYLYRWLISTWVISWQWLKKTTLVLWPGRYYDVDENEDDDDDDDDDMVGMRMRMRMRMRIMMLWSYYDINNYNNGYSDDYDGYNDNEHVDDDDDDDDDDMVKMMMMMTMMIIKRLNLSSPYYHLHLCLSRYLLMKLWSISMQSLLVAFMRCSNYLI